MVFGVIYDFVSCFCVWCRLYGQSFLYMSAASPCPAHHASVCCSAPPSGSCKSAASSPAPIFSAPPQPYVAPPTLASEREQASRVSTNPNTCFLICLKQKTEMMRVAGLNVCVCVAAVPWVPRLPFSVPELQPAWPSAGLPVPTTQSAPDQDTVQRNASPAQLLS